MENERVLGAGRGESDTVGSGSGHRREQGKRDSDTALLLQRVKGEAVCYNDETG